MPDAEKTVRHERPVGAIWFRRGREHPFIVWEGDQHGAASGLSYRRRWQAILAAWWASRYSQQDVWIERKSPRMTTGGS